MTGSPYDPKYVILVNSQGSVINMMNRFREQFNGSDATGSDGDTGRVLTLTTTSGIAIQDVFVDGMLLSSGDQYTSNDGTKEVTLVNPLFDSQKIVVFYNA